VKVKVLIEFQCWPYCVLASSVRYCSCIEGNGQVNRYSVRSTSHCFTGTAETDRYIHALRLMFRTFSLHRIWKTIYTYQAKKLKKTKYNWNECEYDVNIQVCSYL